MDNVGDKIRAGARWLGSAKIVIQLYNWVLTVMTLRVLAPQDYALMAMAGVFISFIVQFEELGLRVKLVQMKDYTVAYARTVYGMVILTNIALVVILIAASPLIAAFFKQDLLVPIIMVLCVGMIVSALGSIPDALVKRSLDFRSLAIVDVTRAVVSSTATYVMALNGFGVWSLVLSVVIGDVVRTVGLMIASPFREGPSFNFKGMSDTMRFGGTVMLQRLVWWAYSGLDSVLIGRFYPAYQLGIYGTASTLASLPLEKVGNILNVLSFTGLSRVNDDKEVFRYYLARSTKMVSLILFPTFFGIAAIANEFSAVVLGQNWEGLGPIAAILALSGPARCVNAATNEALNSLGRPMLHLWCGVVTAILFALGIVSGMPFGLHAVAAGIVVASLLGCIYCVFVVTRELGMSMVSLFLGIWRPTVASIAMLLALLVIRSWLPIDFPSLAGMLTTVALGVAFYAGAIALGDRDGLRLIRDLLLGQRGRAAAT